jgi:hypothetical protein
LDHPARFVGSLAAVLALVAVVILIPTVLLPTLGVSLTVPGIASQKPEPKSTEAFLRGNKEYNAALVWDSLSDDVRNQMGSTSEAPAAFQAQMRAAQQRGYRVEDISYVGGRELPDGTSMQFYLVGFRSTSDADLEYTPFLFTLDKSGKIAKVQ